MNYESPQKKGFGVLGLAFAGFIFLGPGSYLFRSDWKIPGIILGIIGLFPLIYDILTLQRGLYFRLIIVGLSGSFSYLILTATFGKP